MFDMSNGAVRLRLSEILKDRDMRQKELAELTGLSENTISDLCGGGVRQIRLDTIDVICKALGIQPGDLFVMDGAN